MSLRRKELKRKVQMRHKTGPKDSPSGRMEYERIGCHWPSIKIGKVFSSPHENQSEIFSSSNSLILVHRSDTVVKVDFRKKESSYGAIPISLIEREGFHPSRNPASWSVDR